jgi:DnaJ-class molecular chaperone
VRDPRFDRRHVCDTCDGEGRHRITGAECPDCGGAGVVTDPERGEQS